MRKDRKNPRGGVLCSEIVDLHLQSSALRERELKVNLEEIWATGALFQTEVRLPPSTSLWFSGGGFEFRGKVITQTSIKGIGYLVEMRFEPGCTWSLRKYRPKHFFNPMVLLANRIFEAMPNPPTFARTAAGR
jgi:hypothetical protein